MYIPGGDRAISHAFIGRLGNFSDESVSIVLRCPSPLSLVALDNVATHGLCKIHRAPAKCEIFVEIFAERPARRETWKCQF